MSKTASLALHTQIVEARFALAGLFADAVGGEAWKVLGYRSWDAFVASTEPEGGERLPDPPAARSASAEPVSGNPVAVHRAAGRQPAREVTPRFKQRDRG
jgi:hypothetical protein